VNRRQTVVMVTHDARAAAYGDRIVTMKDGGIAHDVSDRNATAAGVC
jgi:ABC-type lipoprotein export system ATPase subunit